MVFFESAAAVTHVAWYFLGPVLKPLINVFRRKPKEENVTMQQIHEANIKAEAEDKKRAREAERQQAAVSAARSGWLQEAKAEESARNADTRIREAEERAAASREREQAALIQLERATSKVKIREAEEQAAASREREQAAKSAAATAKLREEAANAKAAEASDALQQGIRPIKMPTMAQYNDAKRRVEYNPDKFHFAVCGTSGSGKSTLINAFRGLGQKDEGAAAVGVTETTSRVTRYPDPRSELPYLRFVWYDIPGAGTLTVSDWRYFNDHGLFVFDFIIMVYDVRFTTIDVNIIENCNRFNIPVFIVRSKADQHIDNMIKALDIESGPGDDDYNTIYQETKLKYVKDTKSDFNNNMRKMSEGVLDKRDRQLILNQRAYLVNAMNVRRLVNGKGVDRAKLIDEGLLVEDLLTAAVRRRYSEPEQQGFFASSSSSKSVRTPFSF